MNCYRVVGITLLVLFTLVLLVPDAIAGSWSTPYNFSTSAPDNTGSNVGLDDSGNGSVVWLGIVYGTITKSTGYSRTVDPSGNWSAASVLPTGTRSRAPLVSVTPSGKATAFWSDNLYSWSDDKLADRSWGTPIKVSNSVLSGFFVSNRRGDAAFIWSSSAPGAWSQISVLRRPAGGVWGAVQNVISGSILTTQVTADSAALGDNGDIVIAYETYKQTCSPICQNTRYQLAAARQASGTSTWNLSNVLTAAENYHAAATVMDAAGDAAIIYGTGTGISSVVQPGAGQGWSSPVSLYNGTGISYLQIGASTAGAAVAAFIDAGKSVQAISGNIVSNSWTASAVISAGDASATQLVLAVGPTGAAVTAWNGPFTNYLNCIRAAVLPASGQWGLPSRLVRRAACFPRPPRSTRRARQS